MNFFIKNYSLSRHFGKHLKTNKNIVNKTQLKTIVFLFSFLLISLSCSKDDPTPDSGNQGTGEIVVTDVGVKADDFDTYPGDVGFVIDARELAKKGYMPTQAVVTVNASHSNYSQTIDIDPITLMGQIKISKEGLSEAAISELTNGVSVTSVLKNTNGETIMTDPEATVSFLSNPNARTVNATSLVKTTEHATINLSENTTYYIQSMNPDGSPDNNAWRHLDTPGFDQVITANVAQFNGNEPDRGFTFIPIPGEFNTFAIRNKASSRFVRMGLLSITTSSWAGGHWGPYLSTLNNFAGVVSHTDYDHYKFKFQQTDDGSYIIRAVGLANDSINQIPGFGLSASNWVVNTVNGIRYDDEPRTWRLISTTIDWDVQNIGTNFLEPILGPAQTAFGFNSTLTNCGQGSLSQTVGTEINEQKEETVGWEESLSFTSTSTTSISATVGVEFEAGFFGASASYSASVTAGYDHTQSETQTSSEWLSKTKTDTENLFSERTVTVPSGSASLVYDVYQFYDNTLVNFVQRLRISGIDSKTGLALSGEEIQSQFHFSGFNGVISAVESTSIVITLRGTTLLNKIFKTESSVQDVAANCQ